MTRNVKVTSVKLCTKNKEKKRRVSYVDTPDHLAYHRFPADGFYKTVDNTSKRFGDNVDSSNNSWISIHASFPGSTWSVPVDSSSADGASPEREREEVGLTYGVFCLSYTYLSSTCWYIRQSPAIFLVM